jgi:ankyrin repeat protein
VYCQVVYICGLIPARIRPALAELPDTLDETYERTLREINKAEWEIVHRLFQFVAVAFRPLRVEELAELLAFDFEAGPVPKFHEDWRLEDPIHAILSTCPSFLSIVDNKIRYSHDKLVQFSHFSVKEFLTSARLAKTNDIILRRYHIYETPAHILAARACLGYWLHLDMDATVDNPPFTRYSWEHWVDHARLEEVSRNVKDGLKELFDLSKPHLARYIWFCEDPALPSCEQSSLLSGTPLHYAAIWGFHSIIELFANEHSQNMNSQDFTNSETPLHVASKNGHLEFARILIERGADVSAQDKNGQTPLHLASQAGQVEIVPMLIKRGAGVSTQNEAGQTPLHVVSLDDYWWHPRLGYHPFGTPSRPEVARQLIERGVDVSAQDKDGRTPLHLASQEGRLEIACMLIERGADVSAQDKAGRTPLHLASQKGRIACMLIERGADVSAQDKEGRTHLHLVLRNWRQLEVARMLIERGADVAAQDKEGQTPLHLASQEGRLGVARTLTEHGADVSAQDKDGQTPLHLVNWYPFSGRQEVARMLVERGADMSAQDKEGRTPMHIASQARQLEDIRMLPLHGADASVQK